MEKKLLAKDIYIRRWTIDNPKAVIQIVHGMAEHSGRYEEFAHFLNRRGFDVYACDHPGHGQTVKSVEKLGFIGYNGFDDLTNLQLELSKKLKERYEDKKLFIYAHSFGSFLGINMLQNSSICDGMIISGGTKPSKILNYLGKILAFLSYKIYGEQKSPFIEKMIFGSYNKRFENRTKHDWLSKDKLKVDLYLNDPLCGAVFPNIFYLTLANGLIKIFKNSNLEKIPKDKSILIVSGKDDPIGDYGKGVLKLFNLFKNLKIKDLKISLIENGRHELVNELDRGNYFNKINEYLSRRV